MEMTCFECQQTWEPPGSQIAAAKLRFGLGSTEYAFACPNCDAKNVITEDEFRSASHPGNMIPVTGAAASQSDEDAEQQPPRADNSRGSAPTNPVPGPETPAGQGRHGVVVLRTLPARREPNIWAEIMGEVGKNEQVTILEMRTDGENTWAQIGPERWVPVEQDGETLIQLTDGR
jgi:hypothetical protein